MCRLSMLPLLVALFPPASFGMDKFADPVSARFHSDKKACLDAITSGDLASSIITTGSMLYHWRDFPNFLDLTRRITTAYKYLSKDQVAREIARRKAILEGAPCGFMCLDVGLMELALGDLKSASNSFHEVTQDSDFKSNPFPWVLVGKARIGCASVGDATAAYRRAEDLASVDKSALFRVRYEYALDLLDLGYNEDAVNAFNRSRESEYPLEQAWALEELINHAVSQDNWTELRHYYEELILILTVCSFDTRNNFEGRRFQRATLVAERAKNALDGNDFSLMAMDDESFAFLWRTNDLPRILERTAKWATKYPLTVAAALDPHPRRIVLENHFHLNVVRRKLGFFQAAEEGFKQLIQVAEWEEAPDIVIQAHGWLANTLRDQNKLEESFQNYRVCLQLDAMNAVEAEKRGLPMGPDQPAVQGGRLAPDVRAGHVDNYQYLLQIAPILAAE